MISTPSAWNNSKKHHHGFKGNLSWPNDLFSFLIISSKMCSIEMENVGRNSNCPSSELASDFRNLNL